MPSIDGELASVSPDANQQRSGQKLATPTRTPHAPGWRKGFRVNVDSVTSATIAAKSRSRIKITHDIGRTFRCFELQPRRRRHQAPWKTQMLIAATAFVTFILLIKLRSSFLIKLSVKLVSKPYATQDPLQA
jgi:hypothetical protein